MLNLFDPIVVPGVEHVTLFHDDQDATKFYMMPELPTIAFSADGKTRQFSLMMFSRDFHLMKDAASQLATTETEGGLFTMTTELRVSEADQQKIIAYLRNQHNGLRPIFSAPGRFLLARFILAPTAPITLAYPIWVDGNVAFDLIPSSEPTFVKGTEASAKPSLMTTNLANYNALLGQEGVELVRSMLNQGMTPGSVHYDISFMARIPSLTITVSGKMTDVYQQLRQHAPIRIRNSRVYYVYPGFNGLKDMEDRMTSLTITVKSTAFEGLSDDKGGTGSIDQSMAQDVETKLNELAFTIIQNVLQSQFATPSFSAAAASDPAPSGSSDSGTPDVNAQYLKPMSQSMSSQLDLSITYDKNLPVTKHPSCSLLDIMTVDEAKSHLVEADLSHPFFQILDVSVQVTADFENDPIAAIKVFLDYNQKDENTGETKTETQEYMFTTGKEVYRFQTVMAKAKDGSPKDSYTYHSEIIYKATAQPQTIAPQTTRDRALIIGYNQLSCVRVAATWGAIPADVIQKVLVHFQYPGLNSPTAQKDVYLSSDHTTDSWFTYTNANASPDYQVQLTYFLNNGKQLPKPVQKCSSGTFIVNSPFTETLNITFVPQGMFPPIANILLSVRYEDTEAGYLQEAVHTFADLASTWTWSVPVLDKTKRSFQYKFFVTNTDATTDESDWITSAEATVLVGQTAKQMLEVDVVPSLLDLQTQWKLVIARLKYEDPANHIEQDQIFQITSANAAQTLSWKVMLKDPAMKNYTYSVDAYGYDSANNKKIGPTTTNDPLLVLQL